MLDAQPLERPPDLRRLLAVDRASLGGEKVVGAPVGIKAERQARSPKTSRKPRNVEAVPSSSIRKAE